MSFQQFASIAQQLRATRNSAESIRVFLAWLEQEPLRAAIVLAGQPVQWHHNGVSSAVQRWLQQRDPVQHGGYPEVKYDVDPTQPVLLLPLYYGGCQQGVLAIENVSNPVDYLMPTEMLMTRLDHLHQQEQTARTRQLTTELRSYRRHHERISFFMHHSCLILNTDEVHIFDFKADASEGMVWFTTETGKVTKVASGHRDHAAFSAFLQASDLFLFPGDAAPFLTPEMMALAEKRAVQQFMLVPLWQHTQVTGAIAYARRSDTDSYPFTEHEQHIAVMLSQAFARHQSTAQGITKTNAIVPDMIANTGISLQVQASYNMKELTHRVYAAIQQVQSPDIFVFITLTESADVLQVTRFVQGHEPETRHDRAVDYPLVQRMLGYRSPVFWRSVLERQAVLKSFDIDSDGRGASFAGLPLIAREHVVGAIFSESGEENAFSEHDLQFMLTLANSAAFAIENMQLLENTTRRIYEMTIINDVSNMLAQDFGSEQMWQRLLQEMALLFPDALPSFCLYDAPSDRLYLPEMRVDDEHIVISPPDVLARVVLSTGITLHFEDIQQETERLDSMGIVDADFGELRAWLGTPLRNRNNEPVGVLALQSDIPGLFRSNDTALLSTLAAQVSLALDNTRLLHSQEERRRTASTLIDMGRVISATLNVDEVYERVIEQMMKVIAFDRAAVLIPSPTAREPNCLLVQAATGYDPRYIHTELLCPANSPLLKIVSSQHPMVMSDAQMEHGLQNHGMLERGNPHSWMGVPMVHQNRFIGLIVVDHHLPGLYREEDAATIFALARQAAIAVENARLHMEAATNVRALEKRAHRLTSLHRIASIVNSSLTEDDILNNATSLLREIFRVDYCAILRFRDENGYVMAEYPEFGLLEKRLIVKDTQSYESITRIVQENRPLVLKQATLAQNLGSGHEGRRNYESIGAEISLIAPMVTRDSVEGCIILSSRDPERHFSGGDRDTFMTMASQIAMAIRNADLYDDAVVANRLKSEFLATVSHELRTPLNAIIGYSEMLINGSYGMMTDKQINRLNRVYRSGKNLLDLISDILDLSRIEAGKLELERINLNVGMILREAPDSILAAAEAKGLEVRLDIAKDLPEIEVDAGRLRQVLLNLLSNAVKFTVTGEIHLKARQVTVQNRVINGTHALPHRIAAKDGVWLLITVSDTGIGIHPDGHELIFEAFRQLDGSTVREYEGTGLGLAITKQLVTLHNGFVWVESEPAEGSDFYVLLPTGIILPEAPSKRPTDLSKPVVLVVDDDEPARTLVKDILSARGYEVVATENPREVQALAHELNPDAIITDVMMPGMDGWNVLQVLKDDMVLRDIPVIVLSILDKESIGYYWGAAGYLTKPVRPIDLLNMLAKVVRPKLSAPILSVDNNPRDRKLVMDILIKANYPVQGVGSGETALAWLERYEASMIITDVMMTGMDGFEVLKELRKSTHSNAQIPAIVVTGQRLSPAQVKTLRGQNAYLLEKHNMTGNALIEQVQVALNRYLQTGRKTPN